MNDMTSDITNNFCGNGHAATHLVPDLAYLSFNLYYSREWTFAISPGRL